MQKYGRFGEAPVPRSRTSSKMRLFTTYSHAPTLRGYEAPGKILEQKTTNKERDTGNRVRNTPANGGIDRRESYRFRGLAREKGSEKGKTGTMQKNIDENNMRKRWGRRRKSQRPHEQNPKRSQRRTRTRYQYVRNPTRAREMDIVPHPAGATSKPGGELAGKFPQEN